MANSNERPQGFPAPHQAHSEGPHFFHQNMHSNNHMMHQSWAADRVPTQPPSAEHHFRGAFAPVPPMSAPPVMRAHSSHPSAAGGFHPHPGPVPFHPHAGVPASSGPPGISAPAPSAALAQQPSSPPASAGGHDAALSALAAQLQQMQVAAERERLAAERERSAAAEREQRLVEQVSRLTRLLEDADDLGSLRDYESRAPSRASSDASGRRSTDPRPEYAVPSRFTQAPPLGAQAPSGVRSCVIPPSSASPSSVPSSSASPVRPARSRCVCSQ